MSFSYAQWVAQNRTARYRLSRKSGWLAYCDSGPRVDLPILSRAETALLAEDDLEDYNLARRTWVSNLPIVRTQQVHHAFTVLDQVTASTLRDGDRVRATAVLDGPSGLGKTTVAMSYCRQFHRSTIRALGSHTATGDQRLPVAAVQLGHKTTPKGLLVKLASFYTENVATSINSDRLAEVVLDLVTSCETEDHRDRRAALHRPADQGRQGPEQPPEVAGQRAVVRVHPHRHRSGEEAVLHRRPAR